MIIIKLYELSLHPRLWFNLSIKLFISKPINKMLMTVFLAEYNLPQWIIVRACSRILERSLQYQAVRYVSTAYGITTILMLLSWCRIGLNIRRQQMLKTV